MGNWYGTRSGTTYWIAWASRFRFPSLFGSRPSFRGISEPLDPNSLALLANSFVLSPVARASEGGTTSSPFLLHCALTALRQPTHGSVAHSISPHDSIPRIGKKQGWHRTPFIEHRTIVKRLASEKTCFHPNTNKNSPTNA